MIQWEDGPTPPPVEDWLAGLMLVLFLGIVLVAVPLILGGQ